MAGKLLFFYSYYGCEAVDFHIYCRAGEETGIRKVKIPQSSLFLHVLWHIFLKHSLDY